MLYTRCWSGNNSSIIIRKVTYFFCCSYNSNSSFLFYKGSRSCISLFRFRIFGVVVDCCYWNPLSYYYYHHHNNSWYNKYNNCCSNDPPIDTHLKYNSTSISLLLFHFRSHQNCNYNNNNNILLSSIIHPHFFEKVKAVVSTTRTNNNTVANQKRFLSTKPFVRITNLFFEREGWNHFSFSTKKQTMVTTSTTPNASTTTTTTTTNHDDNQLSIEEETKKNGQNKNENNNSNISNSSSNNNNNNTNKDTDNKTQLKRKNCRNPKKYNNHNYNKQKKYDTKMNKKMKVWGSNNESDICTENNGGTSNDLDDANRQPLVSTPHPGSFASLGMQQMFLSETRNKEGEGKEEEEVQQRMEMNPIMKNVDTHVTDDTTEATIPTTTVTPTTTTSTTTTTTKKKVAFLLSYIGTQYSGFQMNSGQNTIQAQFELALFKCHYIHLSNFGYPSKYNWSTSGRTDKGVHACAQVVSCKIEIPNEQIIQVASVVVPTMETETATTTTTKGRNSNIVTDTTFESIRDQLNEVLPPDIRVLDVLRTTRTFCAKTNRDKVRYQYFIPSFLLLNPSTIRSIFDKVLLLGVPNDQANDTNDTTTDPVIQKKDEQQQMESQTSKQKTGSYSSSTTGRLPDLLSREQIQCIQKELKNVRVTIKQLELLNHTLQQYVGTHSFHNFSRRVEANESRAKRYILACQLEKEYLHPNHNSNHNNRKPATVLYNGFEWIPTYIIGQSFLLNQIRKMICLSIDITRGVTTSNINDSFHGIDTDPPLKGITGSSSNRSSDSGGSGGASRKKNYNNIMERAFDTKELVKINQAPPHGLFLEMSYYDFYNRKVQQQQQQQQQNGQNTVPTIHWSDKADEAIYCSKKSGTTSSCNNNNSRITSSTSTCTNDGVHELDDDDGDDGNVGELNPSDIPTSTTTTTTTTTGTPSLNHVGYRWKEFRNEIIMEHIAEEEEREGNFIQYLYTQEYLFDYKKHYSYNDDDNNNTNTNSVSLDDLKKEITTTITRRRNDDTLLLSDSGSEEE